jgi:hypothetical protein
MEISEDLLETLDISLNAMGRTLLKDIADVLNIPSKEIIQKVYGPGGPCSKKLKFFIAGDESLSQSQSLPQPKQQHNPCKVLVKHYDGAFYCGSDTKKGSLFCEKHYHTPVPISLTRSCALSAIQGFPNYFATPQGHVITKEGRAVGVIKDSVFYKF